MSHGRTPEMPEWLRDRDKLRNITEEQQDQQQVRVPAGAAPHPGASSAPGEKVTAKVKAAGCNTCILVDLDAAPGERRGVNLRPRGRVQPRVYR